MTLFHASPRFWYAATVLVLFTTACQDSPTDVAESTAIMNSTLVGNLEIVAPDNGATLSGINTLKTRLTDRSIWNYTMYWQVDGGARSKMAKSGSYDVATVDVTTWTWNGAGPYTLTFTAEDKVKGKIVVVGKGSVQIYTGSVSPPPPPPPPSDPVNPGNPFSGATLYVDPFGNSKKTADLWRATRPTDAADMDKIASQPQADWYNGWATDVYAAVSARVTTVTNAGALPVLVAYNIPQRDCGSYAAGGTATPEAYRTWITNFANAIGTRRAVVVLEPDALAGMGCLSAADQQIRSDLLKFAVQTLKSKGAISVYIDAGHSRWQSASLMITRLTNAGIAMADGFALNVSNYVTNAELLPYGEAISAGVGGKHFVIDTSRNGQGPNGEWCNPLGRGLGVNPTSNTGAALVDAFLWIKKPGESDGPCNGGPSSGRWWAESTDPNQAHALGLARRATTMVAFN